jgi:hypothetical protein
MASKKEVSMEIIASVHKNNSGDNPGEYFKLHYMYSGVHTMNFIGWEWIYIQ